VPGESTKKMGEEPPGCIRCGSKNVRAIFVGYGTVLNDESKPVLEVSVVRVICRFCSLDWSDTTGKFIPYAEGTA